MTFLDKLKALAYEASADGENNAACVLCALIGAIYSGKERELAKLAEGFATELLKESSARN
jgi:hypothetical protein